MYIYTYVYVYIHRYMYIDVYIYLYIYTYSTWDRYLQFVDVYIYMRIYTLHTGQVLAIRAGTGPYMKLWHDGLDGIFDFNSAWQKRKHEETCKETEGSTLTLEEDAKRTEKKIAKILVYADSSNDIGSDAVEDVVAVDVDDKQVVHNLTAHHTLSASVTLATTFRSAMRSWHFFCSRIIRHSREAAGSAAGIHSPTSGNIASSRPSWIPDWAVAPLHPTKSLNKKKSDQDKDLVRAHAKVNEFCRIRVCDARRKKERDARERMGSSPCASSSGTTPLHRHWSTFAQEDALDMLRCAELVLEDTATDSTLAELSSHDPHENDARTHVCKAPTVSSKRGKKKNLFLESDFQEEVEVHELSVKNALEVVVSIHQFMLWKLPVPTAKTSKYLAAKEDVIKNRALLARQRFEQHIAPTLTLAHTLSHTHATQSSAVVATADLSAHVAALSLDADQQHDSTPLGVSPVQVGLKGTGDVTVKGGVETPLQDDDWVCRVFSYVYMYMCACTYAYIYIYIYI